MAELRHPIIRYVYQNSRPGIPFRHTYKGTQITKMKTVRKNDNAAKRRIRKRISSRKRFLDFSCLDLNSPQAQNWTSSSIVSISLRTPHLAQLGLNHPTTALGAAASDLTQQLCPDRLAYSNHFNPAAQQRSQTCDVRCTILLRGFITFFSFSLMDNSHKNLFVFRSTLCLRIRVNNRHFIARTKHQTKRIAKYLYQILTRKESNMKMARSHLGTQSLKLLGFWFLLTIFLFYQISLKRNIG